MQQGFPNVYSVIGFKCSPNVAIWWWCTTWSFLYLWLKTLKTWGHFGTLWHHDWITTLGKTSPVFNSTCAFASDSCKRVIVPCRTAPMVVNTTFIVFISFSWCHMIPCNEDIGNKLLSLSILSTPVSLLSCYYYINMDCFTLESYLRLPPGVSHFPFWKSQSVNMKKMKSN